MTSSVWNTRAETSSDPSDVRLRHRVLVNHLIGAGDLYDERVIAAMRKVPRHLFVPPTLIHRAYENTPLPIGQGQTISQPTIVAIMTEALALAGTERVLEIGTGSGYQAAILSLLCKGVFSVEVVSELGRNAQARLSQLGYPVHVRIGNGYEGWPEHAPFDRILITAAPPTIPATLVDQLAEGGLLITPVGGPYDTQRLIRARKVDGQLRLQDLGSVMFVPMVGEAREPPWS